MYHKIETIPLPSLAGYRPGGTYIDNESIVTMGAPFTLCYLGVGSISDVGGGKNLKVRRIPDKVVFLASDCLRLSFPSSFLCQHV
jgi:hypothetical protein